ncbi:hypothetical protein [Martelella lutilitoris]|uniref:hypothetical protein n=1 Tax=Martelella lutilitoris TaxID=2583532 RepID=UPI00165126F5|nr:hypothetical protein [Martelella lutilitoris]
MVMQASAEEIRAITGLATADIDVHGVNAAMGGLIHLETMIEQAAQVLIGAKAIHRVP